MTILDLSALLTSNTKSIYYTYFDPLSIVFCISNWIFFTCLFSQSKLSPWKSKEPCEIDSPSNNTNLHCFPWCSYVGLNRSSWSRSKGVFNIRLLLNITMFAFSITLIETTTAKFYNAGANVTIPGTKLQCPT